MSSCPLCLVAVAVGNAGSPNYGKRLDEKRPNGMDRVSEESGMNGRGEFEKGEMKLGWFSMGFISL